MVLSDLLGFSLRIREALVVGLVVAYVAGVVVTPRAIRKLRGAGIVGRDMHKPGKPEIPEMGGLAVFLAFNAGAFAVLGLAGLSPSATQLVLAGLVVAAGACVTGVLDDLVSLRQRFKAVIPFAFAYPLAFFVTDTSVALPLVGSIEFGLWYPLVLVPLGVACASNGFNMLEGFNGLGAGLGIIMAVAISAMGVITGNYAGLVLLLPLIGALAAFLHWNHYPARVFGGDTMTLMVGGLLAVGGILSKVEFWAALLFFPHIVEFGLKMRSGFPTKGWGGVLGIEGRLAAPTGMPRGLGQAIMRAAGGISERRLVGQIWTFQIVLAAAVVAGFFL